MANKRKIYKGDTGDEIYDLGGFVSSINPILGLGMAGASIIGSIVNKKRDKKLEDRRLEEERMETQKGVLGENYLTQHNVPTFPLGGFIKSNSEIEGGEVVESPQGNITSFTGPSHEQGGIPLNLEEGTKIYSDRLTDYDNMTFAEKANRIKGAMKKYQKALKNERNTRLSSFTAKLMIQKLEKQLNELFQRQEEKKVGEGKAEMSQAGPQIPEFQSGGRFGDYLERILDPIMRGFGSIPAAFGRQGSTDLSSEFTTGPTDYLNFEQPATTVSDIPQAPTVTQPRTKAGPVTAPIERVEPGERIKRDTSRVSPLGISRPDAGLADMTGRSRQLTPRTMGETFEMLNKRGVGSTDSGIGSDYKVGDLLTDVGEYAPTIYNLIQSFRDRDVDFDTGRFTSSKTVTPRRTSLDPIRRDIEGRERATTRAMVQAGGDATGAVYSRMAAAGADTKRAMANVAMTEEQAYNQAQMQADLANMEADFRNKGMLFEAEKIKLQAQAIKDQYLPTALSDVSRIIQQRRRDSQLERMDLMRYGTLPSYGPSYNVFEEGMPYGELGEMDRNIHKRRYKGFLDKPLWNR